MTLKMVAIRGARRSVCFSLFFWGDESRGRSPFKCLCGRAQFMCDVTAFHCRALVQAICFIIAGVIINSTHLISSDALWPSTAVAECYSNVTYYGEVAFDDSITPTGTLASVSQGECCAGNNGGQFTYYSSTQECRYYESGIADGGGGLNYMNNTVPSVGSAWSGGFVPQAPAKKGASYAVTFFICLFVVGFASSYASGFLVSVFWSFPSVF